MSGENTGTIGKSARGGRCSHSLLSINSCLVLHASYLLPLCVLNNLGYFCSDVLHRFKDSVPGPGSYFTETRAREKNPKG